MTKLSSRQRGAVLYPVLIRARLTVSSSSQDQQQQTREKVSAYITDTMITFPETFQSPPQPTGYKLGCSKIFAVALPIAQIALGTVYLHECPKQDYIPIYLIVSGVFGLMLALLACLPCAQEPEDGPTNPLGQLCMAWNSLTSLFLFCWFIAGNVWIYSIYQPNYNKTSTDVDPYCNKTVYLFAFWTTTLGYILFGLILSILCCVMCCLFLCGGLSALLGRGDPASA